MSLKAAYQSIYPSLLGIIALIVPARIVLVLLPESSQPLVPAIWAPVFPRPICSLNAAQRVH